MTIRTLANSVRLAAGGLQYLAVGNTPPWAYQAMIRLFCVTGGLSNDAISSAISMIHRSYEFPDTHGILGPHSPEEASEIAENIRCNGYHVFKNRLPDVVCDRLLRFACSTKCTARASDGGPKEHEEFSSFPRDAPKAVRYDLDQLEVINNPDVQRLLADISILNVAQEYLRTPPIADVTGMWWNTASSKAPDMQAAQFWHFDMDRVRWLKFFIYLTDVGAENGPHSFVKGSHRRGGIPYELLQKGYSRLTDNEINAHYRADQQIEFTALRGTILAEDTRGLHKGKHLLSGDRLMLQLQFSNSLFGGDYPRVKFKRPANSVLEEMIRRFPRVYSNYVQGGTH